MRFADYRLIDTGSRRKLEQIGKLLIDRPAPQAIWEKSLSDKIWEKADIYYHKEKFEDKFRLKDGWYRKHNSRLETLIKKIEPMVIHFRLSSKINIKLKFIMTKNGQIGFFPEQYNNWKFLFKYISRINKSNNYFDNKSFKILNAFAYTGGSSLSILIANKYRLNKKIIIEPIHVDSSKRAISIARENAKLSNLAEQPIRWINDDVISFMKREIRRGIKYSGFILDPPAFGRGKRGKTWSLTRDIKELFKLMDILSGASGPEFIVFSCHDSSIDQKKIKELFSRRSFSYKGNLKIKSLFIHSIKGNPLPIGINARWIKK